MSFQCDWPPDPALKEHVQKCKTDAKHFYVSADWYREKGGASARDFKLCRCFAHALQGYGNWCVEVSHDDFLVLYVMES
jgi:hypothetical protein